MNDDKHNASGCLDLTAYEAINNIEKEEKDQKELVRTILYICRKAGFKVEGRIVLTAVKSGRTYKQTLIKICPNGIIGLGYFNEY